MNVMLDEALREWFQTTFEKLDRLKVIEKRLKAAENLIEAVTSTKAFDGFIINFDAYAPAKVTVFSCCDDEGCMNFATHTGILSSSHKCDEHAMRDKSKLDAMREFQYAGALREYLRTKDEHQD